MKQYEVETMDVTGPDDHVAKSIACSVKLKSIEFEVDLAPYAIVERKHLVYRAAVAAGVPIDMVNGELRLLSGVLTPVEPFFGGPAKFVWTP